MAEATNSSDRRIVTSSSWWIWIILLIGITVVLLLVYGVWRVFKGATTAVTTQTQESITPKTKSNIRFVRTPTEVIVIDDPIIPEGETSVENIIRDFSTYQGEQVVISGSVNKVTSTSYFTVQQGDYSIAILALPDVIGQNELVNSPNPEREYVRVAGTVKLLTREREKTEFGFEFRNLDEAFWRDQIIIEATSISIITSETI